MGNNEVEIDIAKCLRAIKKSYKVVLLATLLALLLGIILAMFVSKPHNEYLAVSSVYSIGSDKYSKTTLTLDNSVAMSQYYDIIKSHKVADRAKLILGDEEISEKDIYDMVSIGDNSGNTKSATVYIQAVNQDPALAVNVANAVAEAFTQEMAGKEQDDIQILDNANEAEKCYDAGINRVKIIIFSTVFGIIMSCIIISMKEILSTKMYTAKDATLNGTLDIIGVIPVFKQK